MTYHSLNIKNGRLFETVERFCPLMNSFEILRKRTNVQISLKPNQAFGRSRGPTSYNNTNERGFRYQQYTL